MSTENAFGNFFRSKRQAISPILREFCRKNGFDAANVSRLERGIVSPPQAMHLLETYAKALRLKEGTADWERFFELAAVGTGRIPADMLEAKQMLPGLFLQMRADAQGHSGWVKARHLEDWAATLDARATLPRLIRRLLLAGGRVRNIDEFGAEEQTQRPGWDGIAEAGAGDAFAPEGTSGWEMGVDKDYRKKFEDDLKKRSKSSLGLDPKKTTFVFVTPRKWQKKAECIKGKTALGVWKEIRVYDSVSLEQWLERSLAVDVWLAERLGLKPEGVISFDDYWANLQALTDPPLKPEVFLASREKQVEALERWLYGSALSEEPTRPITNWLESSQDAMTIEGRSPTEALDFVVAFSRNPKYADLLAARALIVETRSAWRRLVSSEGRLLLVPHPTLSIEPELIAEAVRKGNRVLLLSTQEQREHIPTIKLARVYRHDLMAALESSGVEVRQAQKCAREAGGSLTVLKRLLGRYPGTLQPGWSGPQEAPLLVPILLAGSWNESFDGDRSAVERIAGRPYSAVNETVARWLKEPDSPIRQIGSRVSLVSRDDSWFFLASNISQDALNRFEGVALEVLAEDNPTFELPPEQRWEAAFRGREQKYSPALRQGLAETLALLGSRPKEVLGTTGTLPRVEQTVRKLLDGQDGLRWASLSYQLPLLAEAGPDAFLVAVEQDLKRSTPAMNRLFEEGGNFLFSSMPHTGLLWALEVASWGPALLPRVSLLLAKLDAVKLPRQAVNTPFRSLCDVFMSSYPQMTSSAEERVNVLQMLVRKCPVVGWRLLLELLPNRRAMAADIHRPSWRDWALTWSMGVTNAEYWYQIKACADLLVEEMGEDVERWKTLVKHVENLPRPSYERFLARLSEKAESITNEDVRRDISDTIREKAGHHRRYATANWALREELLSKLEAVQHCFEPQDAVRKNAWLFGTRWQVLEKLEGKEERLETARCEAVGAIADQEGWPGILRLVEAVETPEEIGMTIAVMQLDDSDSEILPSLLGSADEKVRRFARGYGWKRFKDQGWDWVEQMNIRRWSSEEAARLLMLLEIGRRTWEFADQLGPDVSNWYWQHTPAYSLGEDKSEAEFMIGKYLEHRRASSAFNVIQKALNHKHVFPPSLLMDVLESWLEHEVPTSVASGFPIARYEIGLLFEELHKAVEQRDPSLDINRLAKLEWACLALLDGYPSSPVVLHRLLCDTPEFFVEVLGLCFRPKDVPPKPEEEFTAKERQAAQNAYKLLMEWRDVPASGDGGAMDEEKLFTWIHTARSLAEQRGLLEICDSQIGQVLAHAPHEADSTWPCIPVRDALDEIDSEEMLNGFAVGIYNKRGMVTKSLGEGGTQERELAEKNYRFADACKVDWPKTAAILRRVALGYEEEARREDLSAELRE